MKRKLKKITLPVFVGIASHYLSEMFFLGILLGYVLMKYSAEKGKPLIFPLSNNYEIHVHHWLSATLTLAVIFISGAYQVFPPFLLGFGGGVVFQGIYSYDDWYRVIYKVSNL